MSLSQCPYPDDHPLASQAEEGHCSQCSRYFRRCQDCSYPNRWLARFCRHCGEALQANHWLPLLGSSPLYALSSHWPTRWSAPIACGHIPRWLGMLDGRLFTLDGSGDLRVCQPHPTTAPLSPPRFEPFAQLDSPLKADPCLLQGSLALAGSEQIFQIDLLEGRSSGRKPLRLRGPLLSPLASDQQQHLAALVGEGDHRSLALFRLVQGRLQLQWNQVLPRPAQPNQHFPQLIWCGSTLVYLDELGPVYGFETTSGKELWRLDCPSPLGGLPVLGQATHCYWAGVDGSIWWLQAQPSPQLLPLSGPQEQDPIAMGLGKHQLIVSLGRQLLRIDLESQRQQRLELTQYCTVAPWLSPNQALALTQEGGIFRLSLDHQPFQVLAREKLPAGFQGSHLPPLWDGRHWHIIDQAGQLFLGA